MGTKPETSPTYTCESRTMARRIANEVHGWVECVEWDPGDGEGKRIQWVVIEEGQHNPANDLPEGGAAGDAEKALPRRSAVVQAVRKRAGVRPSDAAIEAVVDVMAREDNAYGNAARIIQRMSGAQLQVFLREVRRS